MDRDGEAGWMTLGNMRANGARSVTLYCRCGREVPVNVDHLPDKERVPAVCRRYRCSACGKRPYASRPDWLSKSLISRRTP